MSTQLRADVRSPRRAGPDGSLASLRDLIGYTVVARDAVVGRCDDLLFDPPHGWRLTGIVVERGPGRDARLVPVACIGSTDEQAQRMQLDVSPQELEGLPRPGPRRTVSGARRQQLRSAFGRAWSWLGDRVLGPRPDPRLLRDVLGSRSDAATWRSAREVIGYAVDAGTEPVGHVEDLIASVRSWKIEQLLVRDARGRSSVRVPAHQVDAIRWADRTVVLATRAGP